MATDYRRASLTPELIEEALRRLGVAASDAIMVGDSEADTGSARAASVASICVSFGYRRVSLEELGADAIIDDYVEFAAAAKKLKPVWRRAVIAPKALKAQANAQTAAMHFIAVGNLGAIGEFQREIIILRRQAYPK